MRGEAGRIPLEPTSQVPRAPEATLTMYTDTADELQGRTYSTMTSHARITQLTLRLNYILRKPEHGSLT